MEKSILSTVNTHVCFQNYLGPIIGHHVDSIVIHHLHINPKRLTLPDYIRRKLRRISRDYLRAVKAGPTPRYSGYPL